MSHSLHTSDFDYDLPPELIAQHPANQRDQSRLLVLRRIRPDGILPPRNDHSLSAGRLLHEQFPDLLNHLHSGDVLVLNDSKVIPARLRGLNPATGGRFEMLLIEENSTNDWWAMLRPGKRARVETRIKLLDAAGNDAGIGAEVREINGEGHRRLFFSGVPDIAKCLDEIGEVPLPPYIARASRNNSPEDRERYQTVYAAPGGSVAAPTAGLHFTQDLLHRIEARGVSIARVTLHVGLGTFAPVKTETLAGHLMHEERFEFPSEAASLISGAKARGGRIIAVGTTTVRVLESAAAADGVLKPGAGRTRIFIHPPFSFKIVDALVTNFHLPCSTLLMLASAFAAPGGTAGREMVLAAYREAVQCRYRFFSYGDAMLIE